MFDLKHCLELYGVTPDQYQSEQALIDHVREALWGGITCLQLRHKSDVPLKRATINAIQDLCRQFSVPFIINDDVQLALAIDADGVHLGQDDMACSEARALLGSHKIIGVSAHNEAEAMAAVEAGADYLGVGALFPTGTKRDAHPIAATTIQAMASAIDIPMVAIGGITAENVRQLSGLPFAGIAVVSALFSAPSVRQAAHLLRVASEEIFGHVPSALSIAGSDSSGGAGIQADLKTMEAHQVFGQTAITAITCQNTLGVTDVLTIPPAIIYEQIRAVFDDIVPAAVKIGMVADPEAVQVIADALQAFDARNIVVDPVMVATSGATLSDMAAIQVVVSELMPLACLVTPNLIEAEILADMTIDSEEAMEAAAQKILQLGGCQAVLIKGGHFGDGQNADDLLVEIDKEPLWLRGRRVDTENTHGTGCTLSSAIASNLARGYTLPCAVRLAKEYITGALAHDLHLGKGSGPLNHHW